MEETLTVGLQERAYPIHIGSGILPRLGAYLRAWLQPLRYAVISDDQVAALYGGKVLAALQAAGLSGELFTFPAGEAGKRLATIEALAGHMLRKGFDRSHAILALGGGVSGDMAGFLAAIYMRGIPFVQVPTSLLAQVDSSVGGKTGVDIALGKNILGAFYQPRLVLIDTELLQTLPHDELLAGLGEVIKYGVSLDAGFFHYLAERREQILALDAGCLRHVIRLCCTLKAGVVAADERESGLRRVLNFGHTIGHAVEAASGFTLLHGFAVAIGMVAVADLAVRTGFAQPALREEIAGLLSAYGLPTAIPKTIAAESIAAFVQADKKMAGQRLFWVMPSALGKVTVTDQVDARAFLQILGLRRHPDGPSQRMRSRTQEAT